MTNHFLPDSTSTFFPNDQSVNKTPRGTLGKIQRTNNILEKSRSWVERSRAITYGIIWGSGWIGGEGGNDGQDQ